MKTIKTLLFLVLAAIIFESCNRAMTPYEAANHPKGKKCREIR